KEARRRVAVAAWHYAALRPGAGAELRKSVDGLLDAIAEESGPDAVKDASRGVGAVVAQLLAAERRSLGQAAAEVEAARENALQRIGDASLLSALIGIFGGALAASALRRKLAAMREVRRHEKERTAELEQFATRVAHDLVSPLGPVTAGVHMLS